MHYFGYGSFKEWTYDEMKSWKCVGAFLFNPILLVIYLSFLKNPLLLSDIFYTLAVYMNGYKFKNIIIHQNQMLIKSLESLSPQNNDKTDQ